MGLKDADRMANSVDPDQTAPDLGPHCLPRPVCPKIYIHYGTLVFFGLLYSCLADATEGFERMEGKNIDSASKTQFVQDVSERK